MKKQHEKMMMDLQRLMAAQDFQSEDQLRAFMTQMLGQAGSFFSGGGTQCKRAGGRFGIGGL